MAERHVSIGSSVGLHARPAHLFCNAAARQSATVRIAAADGSRGPVDAKSILSVLGLGLQAGEQVVLTSTDDTEGEAALDALAAVLAEDHDAAPA